MAVLLMRVGSLLKAIKKHVWYGTASAEDVCFAVRFAWATAQYAAGSPEAFDAVLEGNLDKLRARHPAAFAREGVR